MPLTEIQREVARVLVPFRSKYSYVAGGVALNQRWRRQSDDLDIYMDQRNQLPERMDPELEALRGGLASV